MAVAALINTSKAQIICPDEYNDFIECINQPTFLNYGWEALYKKFKTNVIKILEIHYDICRLFLLHELNLSNNNLVNTLGKLQIRTLIQPSVAIQLTNNLREMLPDADPIYLDLIGEYFAFNQPKLNELIEKITTKRKSYPTLHEYEEHLKVMKVIKSLTVDFKVVDFLRICPDPVDYFKNVKVNSSVIHNDESMSYLSERFSLTSIVTLRSTLAKHKYNLTDTVEALKNDPNPVFLKSRRKTFGLPNQINFKSSENIEFLKEIAFIDNKEDILKHIESERIARKIKFEKAKSEGDLYTCECCYNNELLSSEVFTCPDKHYFCSLCLKKGIEVAVGDNKIDFKCFAGCGQDFSDSIIKQIVDDKLYQRIMRLKQAQEIKNASIEGLESCAFCDYSVILPPDLKIIVCLNPECRKETCRECRGESHIPLRCDQIETTPEVQVRTMIENKMTDVLIRSCYFCNRKFVKEDGCNKMTCACGKEMCYICRKPIDKNYRHFYHEFVIKNKCPLYTDSTIVHEKAVETAARLTINELKEKQPSLLSKIDMKKLLPKTKEADNLLRPKSKVHVNQLIATITGQKIEDINNLDELSEPKNKKAKR